MAFATTDDIAARLGRDLTDAETTMADLLLDGATAVIAEAAGKDDDWAESLDPVPQVLRFVAVEVVHRTLCNPQSLESASEQLGAYQHSERFRAGAAGGGLALTGTEELLVRRAVWGTTTGSVQVESTQVEEVHDLIYGS